MDEPPRPAESERVDTAPETQRDFGLVEPHEPQPVAESFVERPATAEDWSPPPAEPVYRDEPRESSGPAPLASPGGDATPVDPEQRPPGAS